MQTAVFACIIAIAAQQASACSCGAGVRGGNAWEIAKLQTQGATAVFEGTPEHFELQWSLLDAKEGDLIPANLTGVAAKTVKDRPRMVVTFRVQRAYKGDLGKEVQIIIGLGGGDYGAQFAPGLTYLIYVYGPSLRELGATLCSPGGWIGGDEAATDLAPQVNSLSLHTRHKNRRSRHKASNERSCYPRVGTKSSSETALRPATSTVATW